MVRHLGQIHSKKRVDIGFSMAKKVSKNNQRAYFWIWLAVAICMGVWLRFDQFPDQTLVDDEWHAVHQIMLSSPARFMLSFGQADYSIPLTLLYWTEAHWFGLNELGMRVPMMVAGLATLILFPLAMRKVVDDRIVLTFSFFLACSPILISFSRMARPYALTLFLSFCAYACLVRYQRDYDKEKMRWGFAAGYVFLSTISLWLHPITGPFLVAPLIILWWNWLRRSHDSLSFHHLSILTFSTGVMMALAILPPLLADPAALAGKSGVHSLKIATLTGVWYAWLGSGSTPVIIIALSLAVLGAPIVWRSSQIIRWALAGLVLTTLVIAVSRPAWIFNPITFARYLLPAVPVLILFASAGIFRLLGGSSSWQIHVIVSATVLLGWSLTSPLQDQLRFPNSNSLHAVALADFRTSENPYKPYIDAFPISPFWAALASAPKGSLTVAVAPFRFETIDWPAPLWEKVSSQHVIPAYLSGTCEPWLYGNAPPDKRFRFRNAAYVGDADSLKRAKVSYLAFSRIARNFAESPNKPYLQQCETWMRNYYGTPYFDDATLVVWKVDAK
jgi:Dolichyl-phosphate-mannose-protein mannosyltransferase